MNFVKRLIMKSFLHVYNDNVKMNLFIQSKGLLKEFLSYSENLTQEMIDDQKNKKREIQRSNCITNKVLIGGVK